MQVLYNKGPEPIGPCKLPPPEDTEDTDGTGWDGVDAGTWEINDDSQKLRKEVSRGVGAEELTATSF